jgi:hypothetical protein
LFFVSKASIVSGKSPDDDAIPNDAIKTFVMFAMNVNGFERVTKTDSIKN